MVFQRSFSSTLKSQNQRFIEPQPSQRPRPARIGFVLLEHFSLPAFTQALDTLVTANLIQPSAFATTTFSVSGASVVSDLGLVICPDAALDPAQLEGLDLLVVCGGLRTALRADAELSHGLHTAAKKGTALAGLWNGAWFLGQAGLLDGYRCAVHPEQRAAVAEISGHSQVSSESFVVDRDRLTAASPAGAFNMVLEWIGKGHGQELVEAVVNILAFEVTRYRRVQPTVQANISAPLREAIKLMAANLEEPLSQDQLAAYVGRSKRQIGRLFQLQLQTTPVRYYLELRITESRRLLQYSDLPILDVAVACGFVSASHFSKCYASFYGHSPSKETRYGCIKAGARKHAPTVLN